MRPVSLFVLCASITLSAPVAAADKPALIGRWQCQEGGAKTQLEFRSGSSLLYNGEASSYRLQGSTIMVQGDWGEEPYRYKLKDNRLELVFPEGEHVLCAREGRAAKRPAAPGKAGRADNAALRGRLCQWSGSSSSYSGSSYSRTASLDFDGRGGLIYRSESSFSGNAGMAYGSSGGTRGEYRVEGNRVTIRLEDGSQVVAQVNMRQNDGRITELMANGKLWASGLCQ